MVVVKHYALHFDEKIWNEPKIFKPGMSNQLNSSSIKVRKITNILKRTISQRYKTESEIRISQG